MEARMTRCTRNGLVLVLVVLGGAMYGLSAQQRGAQPPAAPAAAQPQETTPPLLFKEVFQQVDAGKGVPTSPRRSNNQYWLAGQTAVTNPNVELKLYGTEAKNITVYLHEGRTDLWT